MPGKHLNVLIVEDSKDDTLLIERELQRGGFQPAITRTVNKAEIINALTTHSWDIIISEHSLPGLPAAEVFELVDAAGLDAPFFIVTGHIGEDIAVSALATGAHDYIMKDNLARLVPAINRELRDAETRKAHKKAQEVIQHLAHYDSLTGLNNRSVLDQWISQLLTDPNFRRQSHVLLYIDLDQFKIINDTIGHVAGDELLKQLSELLKTHIRQDDMLARLGGDEFGIVLKNCAVARAKRIAGSILSAIQDFKFVWSKNTFVIGVSIGVVRFNGRQYRDMASVLSAADVACYAAKDLGRNRIHVYHEFEENIQQRQDDMQWVSIINDALEANRFCLFEQKIFNLSGETEKYYVEFLVRMYNRNGTLVSPDAFISAAERYNLINQIDYWVIKNAFAAFVAMQQQPDPPQMAFINLSGVSFCDNKILALIKQQIKLTGIRPEQICFEVTETAAIANLSSAVLFIEELKQLGFCFALDDFGVGLSSFSYLKTLPVDYLKVDGSFIRDMLDDPMNAAIVESINHVGHVAGLRTIAEFVEDQATVFRLKELGFDHAQGFALHIPQQTKTYVKDHVSA